MELSDIEVQEVVVPLHLRESLEDGRRPTHTVSGRSGDQDGHEKCTRAPSFSPSLPSDVRSLTMTSQFIVDTLIDLFELEQPGRFRGVTNADDVVAILHHHWVLCDDYYPEERQQLQHAIMDIFCASTTSRAGTAVESSCYYGRNESVEYRDLELYALRDSDFPGSVKLGMLV